MAAVDSATQDLSLRDESLVSSLSKVTQNEIETDRKEQEILTKVRDAYLSVKNRVFVYKSVFIFSYIIIPFTWIAVSYKTASFFILAIIVSVISLVTLLFLGKEFRQAMAQINQETTIARQHFANITLLFEAQIRQIIEKLGESSLHGTEKLQLEEALDSFMAKRELFKSSLAKTLAEFYQS